MPNQLPLTIQMGALPLSFQGTPQQLADAIAARLSVITQETFALFVSGTTEPSSNAGPWRNTNTEPAIWYDWDPDLGNYQPMPVADVTLRYILSATAPDPDVFRFWIELNGSGKALRINTYYNGAWHDIYEDTFATMNAATANVFKPYGPAGSILTSNGPDAAPTWNTGLPIGAEVCYGGSTAPTGWLTEDGSLKAIASYPALFAVIGSQYGGDGITTFAVPDMRGRGATGIGTGDALGATPVALGQKIGAETVVLTQANLPSTGVTIRYQNAKADGNSPGGGLVSNPGPGGPNSFQSDGLGSDVPVNIVSPGLGKHWIIKYQ